MRRMERRTADEIQKRKDLAKRILSVGIATTIVGGSIVGGSIILSIRDGNNAIPKEDKEIVQRFVSNYNNETNDKIVNSYPPDIVYTVLPNDNLVKICKKHGLDPNYYLMLAYYNRINNPNLIFVGDKIIIPAEQKLIEKAILGINNGVSLLRDNYHLVKQGERLYNICKEKYGNGEYSYAIAYWQQIDPHNIEPNQIIYLLNNDELKRFVANNSEEILKYKELFSEDITLTI